MTNIRNYGQRAELACKNTEGYKAAINALYSMLDTVNKGLYKLNRSAIMVGNRGVFYGSAFMFDDTQNSLLATPKITGF